MKEQAVQIPLAKLHVSELNTRQPDPKCKAIAELAAALKKRQITPIVVRPHPKIKSAFEIVAGARRRVAAEVAGLKSLEAVIKPLSDDDFEEAILTDNLQREDPDPRAEAELLRRMIEKGIRTVESLAANIGKPESWVARRLRLLTVIPQLMKLWAPGKELQPFSIEMMEFLGSLPENIQKELSKDLWQITRAKSRKDLEKLVDGQLCNLGQAPFDINDPRFFNEKTNCGPGCNHDSSKERGLFDFDSKKKECGRCLAPDCFHARLALWREQRYRELCGEDKDLPIFSQQGEIQIGSNKVKPNYDVWDLKAKPEKNAMKVIFIDRDTQAMSIRYLPVAKGSTNVKGAAKLKSDSEKQEERKNLTEGKRWLAVQKRLSEALDSATLNSLTVPIDHLICVFGLPFKESSSGFAPVDDGHWNYINNPSAFPCRTVDEYGRLEFEEDGKDVPREESLWPAVKVILKGLIPPADKVSDAQRFANCYRQVAKIIGFDIETAKREINLEILPPKSMGPVDPHTLEPVTANQDQPSADKPAKKPAKKKRN